MEAVAVGTGHGRAAGSRQGRAAHGRRWRFALAVTAVAAAAGTQLGSTAAAAPDCRAPIAPKVLASTGDVLEYGIFDATGRFFYSDQTAGELMRLDHFGATPVKLAAISSPGAMVFAPDGSIIIGQGDSVGNGAQGDVRPQSGLLRVDPDTGAVTTYATGLGMANGVALAPDGTVYATNDIGSEVDRVKGGKVDHGWASVYSSNGAIVSPDNRYLYLTQTFAPAAIKRVTIADPAQVTTYATAPATDIAAGLDDMTTDARGNLYVAANGAGQVWKVAPNGTTCVLARGLLTPSDVNFGVGTNARNLYVVGFDGHITELPDVLPPAPRPPLGVPRRPATRHVASSRSTS